MNWWHTTLLALAGLVVGVIVITLVVMATVPVGRGIGGALRRTWNFIKSVVIDSVRAIVAMLMALVFALLALLSLAFVQVEAAKKFGVAAREEAVRVVVCLYRVMVGNPGRLLGLERGLEGLETRLPGVLSGTWGDVLSPRSSLFPGYEIEGTLPSGGSGAKLYVATPDKKKMRELLAEGASNELAQQTGTALAERDRVVIKSFTTFEDATLPQLVRESRGLEAGKRLGLILDHGFGSDRFYYVMRYVPGAHLRSVTASMHERAAREQAEKSDGKEGLDAAAVRGCLSYMIDLLGTLQVYHEQGLWHKDVKPDNIIIEPAGAGAGTEMGAGAGGARAAGRARLVDVGLVSSLKSAMTLTTHGTEYYRDPEMVRQALKGVKVSEVDGTRFDLYAAGAVLYSMIEDSFPAQGVLSPIEKRCPPVVAWIIRRAMADYRQRYASALAMLEDVREVALHATPMTMRIADLPSVRASALVLQAEVGEEAGQDAGKEAGEEAGEEVVRGVEASEGTRIGAALHLPMPSHLPLPAPQPVLARAMVAGTGTTSNDAPSSLGVGMAPPPARTQTGRALRTLASVETANDDGARGERDWWRRVTTPTFNATGLPSRVRIENWWTGTCVVEE